MHRGKVSVIVPVYNVEKYIDKCMESLLNQTYKNIEIILINDGSTDNSGDICDKYRSLDSRVMVFHKENGGVSSARNIGLDKVTGEYVTFVDPDDWVELYTVEHIVSDFLNNDTDAVFYGYDEILDDYVITHSPDKTGIGDTREAIYQMMIGIGKGYYTIIANKAFKTEIFKSDVDKYLYFNKDVYVGEDGLWLTQMIKRCKTVFFDNRVYYHWLQHGNSASNSKVLSDKRLSAIMAQKMICREIEMFDQYLIDLAKAKLFNDIFFMQVIAYKNGEKEKEQLIKNEINAYKKLFFKSPEFSKVRKIKIFICTIMMKLLFSGELIDKFMDLTVYDIKNKERKYGI